MKLADAATMKDVEGCVENPCRIGLPANDIRPVANSAFLKDNPAAKALIEEVSVPLADIYAQNAEMNKGADKADDIKKQATKWISDHQDEVDGWLKDARDAGKS